MTTKTETHGFDYLISTSVQDAMGSAFSSSGELLSSNAGELAEHGRRARGFFDTLCAELGDGDPVVVDRVAGDQAQGLDGASPPVLYARAGTVAVVPVHGVLEDSPEAAARVGGTSYRTLISAIATANADDQVNSIALHVSSPGGSAFGVEQAGDAIAQSGKPVTTIYDQLGASGALWLGSQAGDVVVADRGTFVGSLGVKTILMSFAGMLANAGIHVEDVKTDPRKAAGTPVRMTAITDDDRKAARSRIDSIMDRFVEAVSSGRGINAEAMVPIATGELFTADTAISLGLVDRVERPSTAVRRMNDTAQGPGGVPGAPGVTSGATGQPPPFDPSTVRTDTPAAGDSIHTPIDGGSTVTTPMNPGGQTAPAPTATADPSPTDPVHASQIDQARAEAAAAERARLLGIDFAAAPYAGRPGVAEFLESAKTSGTSVEGFKSGLLDKLQEHAAPLPDATAVDGGDGDERKYGDMAAVLADTVLGGGLSEALNNDDYSRVAKQFGESDAAATSQSIERGESSGLSGLTIRAVATSFAIGAMGLSPVAASNAARVWEANINAYTRPESIAAGSAHSSGSLPAILRDAMRKIMLVGFIEEPTIYQNFCRVITAQDFRDIYISRASAFPEFDEVPEGDEPDEATLRDREISMKVTPFGKLLSLTEQMLRNDDMNALQQIRIMGGQAAARVPDRLVVAQLNANPTMKFDDVPFFDEARKNLATAGGEITHARLLAGIKAMSNQSLLNAAGEESRRTILRPGYVIVPAGLGVDAEQVINSPVIRGASNDEPTNARVRALKVLETEHKDGAAWDMVTDPRRSNAAAAVVAFLDNQRTPVIRQKEAGFNKVEWEFKLPGVVARLLDPEAAYRNPGA